MGRFPDPALDESGVAEREAGEEHEAGDEGSDAVRGKMHEPEAERQQDAGGGEPAGEQDQRDRAKVLTVLLAEQGPPLLLVGDLEAPVSLDDTRYLETR